MGADLIGLVFRTGGEHSAGIETHERRPCGAEPGGGSASWDHQGLPTALGNWERHGRVIPWSLGTP